jgi:integrase
VEGSTKTDKPRAVDLDPGTVGVVRAWKKDRGGLSMLLAAPRALVFGDLEGQHRHPERFSRPWNQTVTRAIGAMPDLRHTYATIC